MGGREMGRARKEKRDGGRGEGEGQQKSIEMKGVLYTNRFFLNSPRIAADPGTKNQPPIS